MKFVANRRMALDAREADVDEAGGMSQLRGVKLALTDPKVCSCIRLRLEAQQRANTYHYLDLHDRAHVPLRDWRHRLSELLSYPHGGPIPERTCHRTSPRCATLHLHGFLLLRAQLHLGQAEQSVLVLDVSYSDCYGWMLRLHVYE